MLPTIIFFFALFCTINSVGIIKSEEASKYTVIAHTLTCILWSYLFYLLH